jgi:hypothetical protein
MFETPLVTVYYRKYAKRAIVRKAMHLGTSGMHGKLRAIMLQKSKHYGNM